MANFFISYNKADHPWATWSAWQLEEVGYTVLIQAWDFRPGSNFILNQSTQDWHSGIRQSAGRAGISGNRMCQSRVVRFSERRFFGQGKPF
jgi:hypothetical protein